MLHYGQSFPPPPSPWPIWSAQCVYCVKYVPVPVLDCCTLSNADEGEWKRKRGSITNRLPTTKRPPSPPPLHSIQQEQWEWQEQHEHVYDGQYDGQYDRQYNRQYINMEDCQDNNLSWSRNISWQSHPAIWMDYGSAYSEYSQNRQDRNNSASIAKANTVAAIMLVREDITTNVLGGMIPITTKHGNGKYGNGRYDNSIYNNGRYGNSKYGGRRYNNSRYDNNSYNDGYFEGSNRCIDRYYGSDDGFLHFHPPSKHQQQPCWWLRPNPSSNHFDKKFYRQYSPTPAKKGMKVNASIHLEKGIFEFLLSTYNNLANDSHGYGNRVSLCRNKKLVATTGNNEFNSCSVLSSSCSAACPNQCKERIKQKNLPRKMSKHPFWWWQMDTSKKGWQATSQENNNSKMTKISIDCNSSNKTKESNSTSKKIPSFNTTNGTDFLVALMNVDTDSKDKVTYKKTIKSQSTLTFP